MKLDLFHGDCLDVLDCVPNASVDFILCDLPYGTTKCKWDVILPFDKLWDHYARIIKQNGCVALFGTEPFSSQLRLSNISWYKYDWYWQKDKAANFLFGNIMPLKVIETVSIFYQKLPTYNPQKELNPKGPTKKHLCKNPSKITKNVKEVMGGSWKASEMGESQNYFGKNYEPEKLLPKQLIYFAKEQRGKVHPTQKPVALAEYLINTYTNAGETVLDNCMGSGTTGVACKNTNRNFIGIEKDAEFFNIAKERIHEPWW